MVRLLPPAASEWSRAAGITARSKVQAKVRPKAGPQGTAERDGESSAPVLSAARFPRDFHKKLSGLTAAELPKLRRTFGRPHRHNSVGDFSAQCLNGRRQAMIFRLRGVALFRAQPEAYQPSGNGRNGQAK